MNKKFTVNIKDKNGDYATSSITCFSNTIAELIVELGRFTEISDNAEIFIMENADPQRIFNMNTETINGATYRILDEM